MVAFRVVVILEHHRAPLPTPDERQPVPDSTPIPQPHRHPPDRELHDVARLVDRLLLEDRRGARHHASTIWHPMPYIKRVWRFRSEEASATAPPPSGTARPTGCPAGPAVRVSPWRGSSPRRAAGRDRP